MSGVSNCMNGRNNDFFKKLSLEIFCLSILSGCAAVAVTGGSLGVGYAVTNVARKTANVIILKTEKISRNRIQF